MFKRIILALTLVITSVLSAPVAAIAAPTANNTWYADGEWHPWGNIHWCLDVTKNQHLDIITGEIVYVRQCVKNDVNQRWFAYRVHAVGQMNLAAEPDYVLGRTNNSNTVRMVPFETAGSWTAYIAFLEDKHGHWLIDVVSQKTKKTYYMTFPTHLKAGKAYKVIWVEKGQSPGKGNTQFIIPPKWEQDTGPV